MYLLWIFLLILFLGYPIAFAMFLVPTAYVLITGRAPLEIIPYVMYEQLNQFSLLAIPLFIFAGALVNEIGITEKLVDFSKQLVGRLRGGLSLMTIVVSTLFSGLSGSIVANTATVGPIMIPAMKKEGYPGSYAAGVVCAASSIDAYVPPSIAMILYAAVVGGISIGAMFIAGFAAGILVALLQMLAAYLISVKRKYPKYVVPFRIKDFGLSIVGAMPAIVCAFIIIIGMRAGATTATEIAAVLVLYVILLGLFWYKNLTWKKLIHCAFDSVKMSGIILIILGAAGPFMWVLTKERIIADIVESFSYLCTTPFATYFFFFLILTVAGMVMETTANILILSPIFAQIGLKVGLDPFVMAFVILMVLCIGPVTPPVGISLYAASVIANEKIEKVAVETWPFIMVELLAIILIILFPIIIKFFPNLMGYVV